MTTPFYGQPYLIANAPTPAAAVNIASSTNASPIVVTTSTPHGLRTGAITIIYGHATNTNANGIWRVHVLSTTTFRLLAFDGTNSTGNGVGGATGTSQSLMLPGFEIGEDGVDDIDATLLNVPNEALANMVAWLTYRMLAKITLLEGGTLTTASGADSVFYGDVSLRGATVVNNSALLIGSGGVLQIGTSTSKFLLPARQRPADPGPGGSVNVTNPNAGGVMFAPRGGSSSARNAVIADGVEQQRLELYLATDNAEVEGAAYYIKRADSTVICELWYSTVTTPGGDAVQGASVVLEVVGGVWRGSGGTGLVIPDVGW